MSDTDIESAGSNLRAIVIFSSYLFTCTFLTLLICKDLYTQSRVINRKPLIAPSSQAGGNHDLRPFYHRVRLFAALAALSLGVTWYYMFSFFSLSYRVWAYQNGVALPSSFYQALRLSKEGTTTMGVQLGPWLKDVKLFRDAWEVVLETSPRMFWSQPIFFITARWSIFLGIETHRRKIPHAWAYMVLGQIVAISFAQNLFFLAVLLFPTTPITPTTDATTYGKSMVKDEDKLKDDAKPVTWTPHRDFYLACAFVTVHSVMSIPSVTGTSWFMKVLILPHIALLFPPILHEIVPSKWGPTHQTLHAADADLKGVYTYLIQIALLLQAKVAAESFLLSQENGHLHRHSSVYDVGPVVAPADGALGSLQVLMAALYHHPAVSSVGWDVLLCALSFSCWKATG